MYQFINESIRNEITLLDDSSIDVHCEMMKDDYKCE